MLFFNSVQMLFCCVNFNLTQLWPMYLDSKYYCHACRMAHCPSPAAATFTAGLRSPERLNFALDRCVQTVRIIDTKLFDASRHAASEWPGTEVYFKLNKIFRKLKSKRIDLILPWIVFMSVHRERRAVYVFVRERNVARQIAPLITVTILFPFRGWLIDWLSKQVSTSADRICRAATVSTR